MGTSNLATKSISLHQYGIESDLIYYQLSSDKLHEITLQKGMGKEACSGALAVSTGEFTGRSPNDRFIVKDAITEEKVWWGDINKPFDPSAFDALYTKMAGYLKNKELFVRDCFACADKDYQLSIRVINEYPWSNMFASNMFINPTSAELDDFNPEWLVVNAPGFLADAISDGTRQHNFAS